jgi:hypothetical protein
MADEFAALLDGSDSVLQAPPDGLYYDQAGDNTEFGIFFGKSETSKDTTNIIRDALGKMSILDHGWLPRIKSAHVTFGCVIGWGDEVSSAIDRALTATEYPRAPLEFGELIIKHNQVGRVDEVNTNRTKPTHPTSATSISDWIS